MKPKIRHGPPPQLLYEPLKEYTRVQRFLKDIEKRKTKHVSEVALAHFETFLFKNPKLGFNTDSIIEHLKQNKEDEELRYNILNEFKHYLLACGLSANSIGNYMSHIRAYFRKNFISIDSGIFKDVVKLPKIIRQNEDGLDIEDVRNILLKCNDLRLRTFIMFLSTSALRSESEAITLRWSDIDISVSPTRIHVRAEVTKTGVARDAYLTEEATEQLIQWKEFKYRKREKPKRTPIYNKNDMVFSVLGEKSPDGIYLTLRRQLKKLLDKNLSKTTFHDFRSFVRTTIANLGYEAFSLGYIGHALNSDSTYYKMKEKGRRQFYKEKIAPSLKFLDYSKIVVAERDTRAKLLAVEKDKDEQLRILREEIRQLREDVQSDMERRIKQITLEQSLPKESMKPVYEARRKSNPPPWNVNEEV